MYQFEELHAQGGQGTSYVAREVMQAWFHARLTALNQDFYALNLTMQESMNWSWQETKETESNGFKPEINTNHESKKDLYEACGGESRGEPHAQ